MWQTVTGTIKKITSLNSTFKKIFFLGGGLLAKNVTFVYFVSRVAS
jgi:hypothetical protein